MRQCGNGKDEQDTRKKFADQMRLHQFRRRNRTKAGCWKPCANTRRRQLWACTLDMLDGHPAEFLRPVFALGGYDASPVGTYQQALLRCLIVACGTRGHDAAHDKMLWPEPLTADRGASHLRRQSGRQVALPSSFRGAAYAAGGFSAAGSPTALVIFSLC